MTEAGRRSFDAPDDAPRLDLLVAEQLDLSRNQSATLIANGHVTVNSITSPFKIYDRDFLEFYLYGDANLTPGGSAQVSLLFELDHALESIDWTKVDYDNGT